MSRGSGVWLLALAVVCSAGVARAHDIYGRRDLWECCHDGDCRVAEPGEIVERDNGTFLVAPSGEIFTRAQVKMSPDGRYHPCLYRKNDIKGQSRCILVPAAS